MKETCGSTVIPFPKRPTRDVQSPGHMQRVLSQQATTLEAWRQALLDLKASLQVLQLSLTELHARLTTPEPAIH